MCAHMCHFSYLYPVKDLLVAGHVLQEESLQLLAQLLRRQDPLRLSSLRARAVRQNELEFLFVSRHDEEVLNKEKDDGKKERGGWVYRYFLIWLEGFISNLLWDEGLDVLSLWQEVHPVEARFPPQRTHSPMALWRQDKPTWHLSSLKYLITSVGFPGKKILTRTKQSFFRWMHHYMIN